MPTHATPIRPTFTPRQIVAPATARRAQVTAIIVTYQSHDTVTNTLAATRHAHDTGLLDCIVVDNDSTDGTADRIAREHTWLTLIRSPENLGFGRGCNLGFQRVTTPYILLINPDAVIDTHAIRTLIDFMDHKPSAGIAAPATLDDHGQPHWAGTMVTPAALLQSWLGRHLQAYPDRRSILPNEPPFRTSWVCGAVMMIRSDLFRMLGGFDERFFLYFEETDLCRRAIEHGSQIWAVGNAIARHSGSASAKATGQHLHASCIATHYLRSRRQYLAKHFGLRGLGTEATLRCLARLHRLRNAALQ